MENRQSVSRQESGRHPDRRPSHGVSPNIPYSLNWVWTDGYGQGYMTCQNRCPRSPDTIRILVSTKFGHETGQWSRTGAHCRSQTPSVCATGVQIASRQLTGWPHTHVRTCLSSELRTLHCLVWYQTASASWDSGQGVYVPIDLYRVYGHASELWISYGLGFRAV